MKNYITFEEVKKAGDTGKTKRWLVIALSNRACLGAIKWHGAWRQYCFFPCEETLWSNGCLADVMAFIEAHKNDRRSVEVKPEGPKRYDRVRVSDNPRFGKSWAGVKGTLDLHGEMHGYEGHGDLALIIRDGGGAVGPISYEDLTKID